MAAASAVLIASAVFIVSGPASAAAGHVMGPGPEPGATIFDPQSSDNLPPDVLATMRFQESMQPAVKALFSDHMVHKKNGFAGLAFEGDGLTLYYKGDLTASMRAALRQARECGKVVVKQAAYSLAELQAAADRIHSAVDAHGRRTDIQSVGYSTDGSGLVIEKRPPALAAEQSFAMARAGEPMATAEGILAEADPGVPVAVTTATQAVELASTPCAVWPCRLDDYAPWNGGSVYQTWRGSVARMQCTTGFGVRANGGRFVLTAAHCGTPPDVAFQGKTSATRELMGDVTNDAWAYDLMLIDAPGYSLIFDGSPSTSTVKSVRDWGYWAKNTLVCQSGSTSGTVCNLKQLLSQDNYFPSWAPDSDGDWGYRMYGLIKTEKVDGGLAVRSGDSGGPVFTLMSGGVRAIGIVSAGSESTMLFQDWADVIRLFHGYPETA